MIQVKKVPGPLYWAGYLVNGAGDDTLTKDELRECEAFAIGCGGAIVSCEDEWIGRWNGEISDMTTYIVHVRKL